MYINRIFGGRIMQKRFDLSRAFSTAAHEIFAARDKSVIIHNSANNIKAAGDEVEMVIRRFFSDRLPVAYFVGNGHIIDSGNHCSGQLDIIVADNFNCPVLFQAEGGTAYFLYESVYAFGEVKSSYRSQKDVAEFSEKIVHIRDTMFREPTENDFISTGRGRGFSLGPSMRSSDKRPYKNPLFTFMIFVNSSDLNEAKLFEFYKEKPLGNLPSFICFLDRGILGLGMYSEDGYVSMHDLPDFAQYYRNPNNFSFWTWLKNKEQEKVASAALANLFFFLLNHLQHCTLKPPDLDYYVKSSVAIENMHWIPLQDPTVNSD